MKIVEGRYATAKVFTDVVEPEAIDQVKLLCDQDFTDGSQIRLMPDIHAGKGCTIGTTMTIQDKIVPNLVGVDIGCGMQTLELGKADLNLAKLDDVIHSHVPSGFNVHEGRVIGFDLERLHCYRNLWDTKRLERSIGSLGGGNHFIEANEDEEGNKYLVVHSGSRNLGTQVAKIYQDLAVELCSGKENMYKEQERLITEYKAAGKRKEIQGALKKLKIKYANMFPSLPIDLCYLTGSYKDQYLNDMKICQEYAAQNRTWMINIICQHMGIDVKAFERWETIHNYIDHEANILRKGAVSAKTGEKLLIPINMRDGSLICIGKGNDDWNQSAPHGAGRLMSRTAAKKEFALEDFQAQMKGIYTTSVGESTLDECPMAYKDMKDIVDNIQDTVEIVKIIKPIYNYKASGD